MSEADEQALKEMPGRPAGVTITTPVPTDVITAMGPLERNVSALQIVDEESHRQGLELGKRLKGMKNLILEMFKEPKKKAHELHRAMTQSEQNYLRPIEKHLSLLGGKLSEYERRERIRADEEARQRQQEAAKAEEDRQVAEAVAAEQAGDTELAEAILDTPVDKPVVIAQPEIAEVAGASTRTTYKAEVVNFLALVRYVAEHEEQIGLLEANTVALNGMARALKDNLRIPGVRSVPVVSRSFKAD